MSSAFNIPAGFALVPLEPTKAMIDAGYDAENNDGKTMLRAAWRYMLSAAPSVDAVPVEPHPDCPNAFVCAGRCSGDRCADAMQPLDSALAASVTSMAVPGEPVAILQISTEGDGASSARWHMQAAGYALPIGKHNLYLAASVASRAVMEPVAMTDERIAELAQEAIGYDGTGFQEVHSGDLRWFARCIERALTASVVTVDTSRKQGAQAPAEAKDAVRAGPVAAPVEVSRLAEALERLALPAKEWPPDSRVVCISWVSRILATMASTPASGVAPC